MIPNEAIEAALAVWFKTSIRLFGDHHREDMRAALEAAAPLMAGIPPNEAIEAALIAYRAYVKEWQWSIDGSEDDAMRAALSAAAPLMAEIPEGCPDDIRALGWAVAIHNDYRQLGVPFTFWLFTKGERAIKGEGRTDADALRAVRAMLAAVPDQNRG